MWTCVQQAITWDMYNLSHPLFIQFSDAFLLNWTPHIDNLKSQSLVGIQFVLSAVYCGPGMKFVAILITEYVEFSYQFFSIILKNADLECVLELCLLKVEYNDLETKLENMTWR